MSSPKFRVAILGVARLQAKIRRYDGAVKGGAKKAVNTIAAEVFTDSQHRVPVADGNLKASGRVIAATDANLSASIGYGGTAIASAYALPVHETHRSQSKYLEAPAREAAGKFKEEVTAAIRAAKRGI